jgi:hypothetical protein
MNCSVDNVGLDFNDFDIVDAGRFRLTFLNWATWTSWILSTFVTTGELFIQRSTKPPQQLTIAMANGGRKCCRKYLSSLLRSVTVDRNVFKTATCHSRALYAIGHLN